MVIKFNAEVIGREVLINGMENMGLSGEKKKEITKLISFKEKLLKNTVGAVTDAGNRSLQWARLLMPGIEGLGSILFLSFSGVIFPMDLPTATGS